MTGEEAVRILDPDTNYLKDLSPRDRKERLDAARRIACECVKQFTICHAEDIETDGTLIIAVHNGAYKQTKRILLKSGLGTMIFNKE
jgi:hypothetical protein